jgi:hypothetical protein
MCTATFTSDFQQAARSSIPEDTAKMLFQDIYERLVWATPEQRTAAVLAIISIYNLHI